MAECKSNKSIVFLAFILGLLIMGALAYLLTNIKGNKDVSGVYSAKYVEITEDTNDPEHWGKNFPRQYASFMKTKETATIKTPFGGNAREDKLAKYPAMVRIWGGKYAFAVDYASARGHHYALEDQVNTKRNKPPFKQTGACANCHTGDFNKIINSIGWDALNKTPYAELVEKGVVKHGVVCADCHDPKTNNLRITRPALINALKFYGKDWQQATRQEMRSLVCAQCHVEYYFKGEGKTVVFPWEKGKDLIDGMKIENIYNYYAAYAFTDYKHGETGAPMLKAQHPEYELNSTGVHAQSGVACADCHMPYVREGTTKISDHWIRSPLSNINASCLQCHRSVGEQEMYDRVVTIQKKNDEMLHLAEDALVNAIDAIKTAKATGADDAKLATAFEFQRKGTFYWDFLSADNSVGFHSPQESARILGKAIDYARQAQVEAIKISSTPMDTVPTTTAPATPAPASSPATASTTPK